jgi:hypothetical protein
VKLATLFILLIAAVCAAPKDPAWEPFEYLVGDWGGGSEGGATFRFSLDGKVLIRDNKAGPHQDLLVIYRDTPSSPFRAIYFDNEDHVIHYGVSVSEDRASIQFLSDAAPTAPRYRMTMKRLDPKLCAFKFEIAPPGKPDAFKTYIEAQIRKK